MTAQETKIVNGVKTTLSSQMAAGATSFAIASASGVPAVPFYVVIDPLDPAKREYMLIDTSIVGTTLTMSGTGKRNLPGSAGAVQHESGAEVRISPPMAQLFDDIHDRIDAHEVDTSDAHDASAISYAGGTGMSATDVEAAIDELATEKANLTGGTFTGDISVPDEAYDATAWNGSLEVPTKNAVRDKIESLSTATLTSDSGTLAADVTLTADTHVDIKTTGSLAIGTWLVTMTAQLLNATSGADIEVNVVVGSATATFTGPIVGTATIPKVNGRATVALTFFATVTVAGTIKMRGYAAANPGRAEKTGALASGTLLATGYTAVKIA